MSLVPTEPVPVPARVETTRPGFFSALWSFIIWPIRRFRSKPGEVAQLPKTTQVVLPKRPHPLSEKEFLEELSNSVINGKGWLYKPMRSVLVKGQVSIAIWCSVDKARWYANSVKLGDKRVLNLSNASQLDAAVNKFMSKDKPNPSDDFEKILEAIK